MISGRLYVMRGCLTSFSDVFSTQRRMFDWDPRVTKRDGKPAFTGTKHAFVAAKIPVVLLRDVDGLGVKGAIVEVKRGYARNVLVPKGDAVYGTTWENIDEYADPDVATRSKVERSEKMTKQAIPFDWLNGVRIELLRTVKSPGSSTLEDPVSIWDVLSALSSQENIDFLPSQIVSGQDSLGTVGKHKVDISVPLTSGTYSYSVTVDIKDKAEVAAAERREEELREAMKMKRPEFVLGAGRLSKASTTSDDHERDEEGEHDSDSE